MIYNDKENPQSQNNPWRHFCIDCLLTPDYESNELYAGIYIRTIRHLRQNTE